MSIFKQWLCY